MKDTFARLQRVLFVSAIALSCTECIAQYSEGEICLIQLEYGYAASGPLGISSPIGVGCDSSYYGNPNNAKQSISRNAVTVHIGNTTEKLRADLAVLKAELEALKKDYQLIKTENNTWKASTLTATIGRIEKMPEVFASLKSVRDVLAPLIVEAIKNDPGLVARLKVQ